MNSRTTITSSAHFVSSLMSRSLLEVKITRKNVIMAYNKQNMESQLDIKRNISKNVASWICMYQHVTTMYERGTRFPSPRWTKPRGLCQCVRCFAHCLFPKLLERITSWAWTKDTAKLWTAVQNRTPVECFSYDVMERQTSLCQSRHCHMTI